MDLSDVKIYRMTHIENIPHILQYGITHKDSPNANATFVNIGDVSLISTRSNKLVRIDNGDFSKAHVPNINLGNFIPFYFGIRMPMLYVMQSGGNFVEKATPPKDIVYLVCSVIDIVRSNKTFYFSDGHATDNLTTFYDRSKVNELPSLIDWNAIRTAFWGGQENLNLKRKKQAEFLISEDISQNFLIGFGCYNEAAKQRLIEMGVSERKIKVIPNAYY